MMKEATAQDLQQRYSDLATDELLTISVSGELTETARKLLYQELKQRGVTREDFVQAEKQVAADLGEQQRQQSAKRKRKLIWLAMAVVVVAIKILVFDVLKVADS